MRCEDVKGLFSEIYDGVANEQAAALSHIENCPECKAEYESYSQLFNEIKELPEPELPLGFHEFVMEKIQDLVPPTDRTIDELLDNIETRNRKRKTGINKRGRQVTRRWAGVAAAACLLLASMWAMRTFDWPRLSSADDDAAPMQEMAYDMPMSMMEPAVFDAELEFDEGYEFNLPSEERLGGQPQAAPESEDTNWAADNESAEFAMPEDASIPEAAYDDMDESDDFSYAEAMPQNVELTEEDMDFGPRIIYGYNYDTDDTEGEYIGIEPAAGEISIAPPEDSDFTPTVYTDEALRAISPLSIVGISALCTAALGIIIWVIKNRIKKGEATCPKTESH